ncbi:MAG: VOC family protein [Chloroflexota bacterium]
MDYETYREQYFVEPAPEQRFGFEGLMGAVLFFAAYETAVSFYEQVLGPPAYVEGDSTKGWQLGATWLTLLRGRKGDPSNVEIPVVMSSPAEAERLQQAFVAAGATGVPPSDQLMYWPVRSCPVRDPFGTNIMIYSRL